MMILIGLKQCDNKLDETEPFFTFHGIFMQNQPNEKLNVKVFSVKKLFKLHLHRNRFFFISTLILCMCTPDLKPHIVKSL